MPPTSLTDPEIHTLGAKFDIEILEEASYILWTIWKGTESRSSTSTLPACIDTLTEDEELYRALKTAHAQQEYGAIRDWKSLPKTSTSIDLEVDYDVADLLSDLHPTVRKLVAGEISIPVWSPEEDSVDPAIVSHLKTLRIPSLRGKPNLLLHDLGSFREDPLLQKRLKNIFMPNNHTFLVNTSGSGKTRLLLEGLCENWGLYFTSLVDSSLLGSNDVQNSIQSHVPDTPRFRQHLPPSGSAGYQAALKTNRDIAGRIFRQIFLARLIIFDLFAGLMNEIKTKEEDTKVFKERWLLLQLQPSFVHASIWDIFDHLSHKLSRASDSYINSTTKYLLGRVRTLCAQVENEGSTNTSLLSTSETAQIPLFCVLDEAQYAATQHFSSFRSDQHGQHRPILREIVRAWEGQSFGQGVFMVVAGTGISKDVVDQAMASAIMKDSRYRWCSDTGAFDEIEVQRRYLLKYLPLGIVNSTTGKRLLQRIWYWLHGRHRFTAGFVAELLDNGFKRPHGLLNAYVAHFTDFNVTDACDIVEEEGPDPLPVLSQYKLDFSKLKKSSDMLTTIHQLTTHYLMRSVLPGTLGKDEATYVEYGFARFVDSDTKTVAVDEPLVLLAATHWINANHRTSYKYFAKQIQQHNSESNGFENYVAFCIDLVFSQQRRICDVFSFPTEPPAWANLEAELVALHRTGLGEIEVAPVRHFLFSGPSVTLGTNAKTPEKTSEWLEHRSTTPICFPHVLMGPDLIFVLRLSDGSNIWVALQAKYSHGRNGSLSRPLLRHAMRSVTPANFFMDKDGKLYSPPTQPDLANLTTNHLSRLPNGRTDAGKYSLLRVIASFPADTKIKRCMEEDPDSDSHPIASLNMELLKQLTRKLSPVDFLQGLENPLQHTGKRKRGAETVNVGPKVRAKKMRIRL